MSLDEVTKLKAELIKYQILYLNSRIQYHNQVEVQLRKEDIELSEKKDLFIKLLNLTDKQKFDWDELAIKEGN